MSTTNKSSNEECKQQSEKLELECTQVSSDTLDDQLWTNEGINKRIIEKINSCIENDKLRSCHIENHVCEQLRSFPNDIKLIDSLFNQLNHSDLTNVIDKSAFFCDLIKEFKIKTRNPQKHPLIGKIYMIRQSVRKTFGLHGSSTSSSKSSTKNKQPNKRPCLVWNINGKTIVVLILTTFNNEHPGDDAVLYGLARDYLIKHLLSINPTPSLLQRRSLTLITRPSTAPYLTKKSNSYLLLKPVAITEEIQWPNPLPEFFSMEDMLYINEIITEVTKDDQRKLLENIPNEDVNKNENKTNYYDYDYDDSNSNSSRSTCSSLPLARAVDIYLFERNSSEKHKRTQQWINECDETSRLKHHAHSQRKTSMC